MTRSAVIVDAIRSPMGKGKAGGGLSAVHPVELLATVLQALVRRNAIDPAIIDDVIVGCVTQASEQSSVGRMSVLSAGFPNHVPATMIDRKCGSSQQAIHFAAQGIAAGAYDVVIAGGVESMSRVPMGSNRMRMDDHGPGVRARFSPGLVSQGIAAELVAARYGLSRDELDAYAARSHQRAASTRASGRFTSEIIPVESNGTSLSQDESIRASTTVEGLADLKPAFEDAALLERFPELRWSVTAGNSSQITDGAAALLIMEEEMAATLNLRPRARFVAFDVIADDPVMMLTAPIPATRRVLAKAGMTRNKIDHFEVNEAFASVPLAWNREIDVDPVRVNPRGGAIALGHPLGCSGARLMTTMLNALEQDNGRFGLQTMCEAGGMANATIIERL
ncbi:thiolase family protein [Bradyrhizobium sp. BR13661]|jgi:acetyl-CoA acyltransferase|nr:thiolase family protein [Bradyrhizobium sp. BR13661]MDH6260557.1 acetyl-CoA acyltransferase [Bradyrhizobium sp. BR13661]